MDARLNMSGMTEAEKMDARLTMSGMTNTDGCPIKDVGHDGGRADVYPIMDSERAGEG